MCIQIYIEMTESELLFRLTVIVRLFVCSLFASFMAVLSANCNKTENNLKARFMEYRRRSYSSSEVSRHINKNCLGHSEDIQTVSILD